MARLWMIEAYRTGCFDKVELVRQLDGDTWTAMVVEPAGKRFGAPGVSVVVTGQMLARGKAVTS